MKRFKVRNPKDAQHPYIVLIDDEDAHYLRNYVWSITRSSPSHNKFLLHRMVNQEDFFLHKLIAKASADEKVRFIDGNELNLQKANMVKMRRSEWYAWLHAANKVKNETKRSEKYGTMAQDT